MTLLTRDDAGLPPSLATPRRVLPPAITLHYTTGQELGAPGPAEWWRSIYRFHTGREDTRPPAPAPASARDYDDIAYHRGIDPRDGTRLAGRPLDRIGAHSYGANECLGLVVLGNDDPGVSDVTPEGVAAIWQTVAEWRRLFGWLEVVPHSVQAAAAGRGTACPGDELRELAAELNNRKGYTVTKLDRIAGADKFATAGHIATALYPEGCDVAYLAVAGTDDVAGATQFATATDGALLLTSRTELPEATADALADLAPRRVVAVGGPDALPEHVLIAAGAAADADTSDG